MNRTQALWYEDGLADVKPGGYFAAIGLMLWAQTVTPAGSPLHFVWGFGSPLVLILGGVAAGWVLKRLKARLVFPRSGYVNFERRSGRSAAGRMALLAAASAITAAVVVLVSKQVMNLSLVFGLIGMATFIYLWQKLSMARYLVLAIWSAVCGAGLTMLALGMELGGAAYWVLVGGAMVAVGLVAWSRFSRSLERQAEEVGHGASE